MQTITPYLLYEDVTAALAWLSEVFGFTERLRAADAEGKVSHAEMTFGDAEVMLGYPGPDYQSPRSSGSATVLVHVYVDDVEAHYERAKNAGAEILTTVQDQPYGDRRYDVADLEGHRWSFAQHVRDVPPEEWGAVPA